MALGSLSAHARPKFVETLFLLGIICLFILGVLQGQNALLPFKARVLASQIERYQMAVASYQETTGVLPGDDQFGPDRWGREAAVFSVDGISRGVSFTGDMVIKGFLGDTTQVLAENFVVWQDLRYLGAIPGDPTLAGQSAQPVHSFGGLVGFSERNLGMDQVICATNIPGRAARQIDEQLDDGVVNTGRMRATSRWDLSVFNVFDRPDNVPYQDEYTYILCTPMMPR